MDIKHKRARDNKMGMQQVTCEDVFGRWERTRFNWIDLWDGPNQMEMVYLLDSLTRLKRVPFYSDSFVSVAGLHTHASLPYCLRCVL